MSKRKPVSVVTEEQGAARLTEIAKIEAEEALDRERAKKNKDFVQLSKTAISPLRGLMNRSPRAAQILLSMVEVMGQQDNALQASMVSIEQMTGAAQITVRRALKLLKDEKWIEAVVGLEHTYRVNSTVFWMTYGYRKEDSFQAMLAIPKEDRAIKVNQKVVRKVMPVIAVKTPRKRNVSMTLLHPA